MPQRKSSQNSVTLWIDSYSDIFSDFDPRPFSDRAISEDFVGQLKRVSRENPQRVNVLKILVPEGVQKEEHERTIRKRLEDYFSSVYSGLKEELRRVRTKGITFFSFGLLLMIVSSYISTLNRSEFSFKLMLTLFEPGGWFFFWTGLDFMTSIATKKRDEEKFYEQLQNTHVEFGTYK